MKKLLLTLCAFLMIYGSLHAAKKDGIVVGFSNSSVSNSWRVFMVANFWAEVELHPEIAKVHYADAKDKPYQQRKDIMGMIKKGIDVLIVSPSVQDAVNPAVEKAFNAGIPVIVFDRKVTTDKYTTFIETSNYDLGKKQAEWLSQEMDNKGNIVMFSGVENSGPAMDRLKGARDVFREHKEIKVLAHRFTSWSIDKTKSVMGGLVKKYKDIDGIWADSGLMSWPALEVMKTSGMDLVPSTGDQLNGYAKFLVNNEARGFIQPFPSSLSRHAVKYALDAVKGETLEKYIVVPAESYPPERINKLVKMEKNDFWWIGDDQMPEKFLPEL